MAEQRRGKRPDPRRPQRAGLTNRHETRSKIRSSGVVERGTPVTDSHDDELEVELTLAELQAEVDASWQHYFIHNPDQKSLEEEDD